MPFKARRWLYVLTPQGALEKSRLSLNDLPRILDPSGNCAASPRLQEVESISADLEEPLVQWTVCRICSVISRLGNRVLLYRSLLRQR